MRIYIVRHGEVWHNLMGVYDRNENDDLNETGIKQAESLREKIKDIDYDIVISSPMVRSVHTARIINVKNKEIILDDRLKERDPGALSGTPTYETDRDEYWNYNSSMYKESENIKTFFEKVFSFLDELRTKKYDSVLIVAHSGVSKAFSGYFEGIKDGMFLKRGLKNCEMKEYKL